MEEEEEKRDPRLCRLVYGACRLLVFGRDVLLHQMQQKGLYGSQSRDVLLPSPAQFGLQQGPGEAWLSLWSAEGYGGGQAAEPGLSRDAWPWQEHHPLSVCRASLWQA